MSDYDDQDGAEAIDEDLLVDEGADDTDIQSEFPSDHYHGVLDHAVTEAGDARIESIQERVAQEERDPVVDELDANALAEELEDLAHDPKSAGHIDEQTDISAQIADIEDAALDT